MSKNEAMGPSISPEERKRRQNLEDELKKMEHSLRVTATAHYISSERYGGWDTNFQYLVYFTGTFGTTGAVLSTLSWKKMTERFPRLAPIFAAFSVTSFLFTVAVKRNQIPNSPATLHKLHFTSGIECQYLQRRVRFFAKTDVWNTSVPWTTLREKYENLLRKKKKVNSKIQSEGWAYRAALEKIEKRDKEKRQKEQEL